MKQSLFKTIFILAVILVSFCVNANAETLVFDPAENENWYYHGVFYGRGIELKHGECKGNIYLTSEYYYYPGKWGQEHFPIFESTDGGETFNHISDIYDTEFTKRKYKAAENGTYYEVPEGTEGATTYMGEWWGMIYQPTLFELPEDLGNLKNGTVLCVGTTKSTNYSAIVIYYSEDNLKSWNYLSTVAEGGKAEMEKASAIWEGFLVYENNALYCFYSDERGMTGGGQRLVMKKSTDGVNWSEDVKVCDFEEENNRYRPGMPIGTRLPDGRFMLTYEGVNMGNGYLPDFYKITDNIEQWDYKDHGTEMPRIFSGGSPYCTTMPDGNVIIGGHGTSKIGVNTNSLATDEWIVLDTDIENGYSRCLFPMQNGNLLITSGGNWDITGARKLCCSVEKIEIGNEIKPVLVTGTTPWGEVTPNYDNGADKAADGNPKTFFDGLQDGYVILDLGKEVNISAIGYMARYDFGFRIRGSEFYASKDGENWTKVYTVAEAPKNSVIHYTPVENGEYRYIRYNTNGEEFCSIAEIKIYTDNVPTTVERNGDKLKIKTSGNTKCLAGIYNNDGILIKVLIFDNETETEYKENMAYVKVFAWDEFNVMRPFVSQLQ